MAGFKESQMRRSVAKPRRLRPSRAARIAVAWIDGAADLPDEAADWLQDSGRFRLLKAGSPAELDHLLLTEESLDLVVCELKPWGQGELELLDRIHAVGSQVPVVILTASGSEHWAVEAMKRGAADYIPKTPGYLDELAGRLDGVVRKAP